MDLVITLASSVAVLVVVLVVVRLIKKSQKSTIIFECQKCGYCCKKYIKGMFLTSEEAQQFPSGLISPYLAFGVDKIKNVIAYQLNVDVCPHLTETNQCRIYEKRPLTCKSFPYMLTLVGESTIAPIVSTACPFIGSKVKAEEGYKVQLSSTELESAQAIHRYFLNQCQKHFISPVGSKLWYFDLKTKNWIKQLEFAGPK